MITPERAFLFREQTQYIHRTRISLPEQVYEAFQQQDRVGLSRFFERPIASKYNFEPNLADLMLKTHPDEIFAYLSNSSNSKELQYLPWNFAFNENEIFEKKNLRKY
jgi:hypothetical protein